MRNLVFGSFHLFSNLIESFFTQMVVARKCAMVVPDIELISEIYLVSEGFQEARDLARKFITLYNLCKELLSKQDHYDWGLRAVKSVLAVAGVLRVSRPLLSRMF